MLVCVSRGFIARLASNLFCHCGFDHKFIQPATPSEPNSYVVGKAPDKHIVSQAESAGRRKIHRITTDHEDRVRARTIQVHSRTLEVARVHRVQNQRVQFLSRPTCNPCDCRIRIHSAYISTRPAFRPAYIWRRVQPARVQLA